MLTLAIGTDTYCLMCSREENYGTKRVVTIKWDCDLDKQIEEQKVKVDIEKEENNKKRKIDDANNER